MAVVTPSRFRLTLFPQLRPIPAPGVDLPWTRELRARVIRQVSLSPSSLLLLFRALSPRMCTRGSERKPKDMEDGDLLGRCGSTFPPCPRLAWGIDGRCTLVGGWRNTFRVGTRSLLPEWTSFLWILYECKGCPVSAREVIQTAVTASVIRTCK